MDSGECCHRCTKSIYLASKNCYYKAFLRRLLGYRYAFLRFLRMRT